MGTNGKVFSQLRSCIDECKWYSGQPIRTMPIRTQKVHCSINWELAWMVLHCVLVKLSMKTNTQTDRQTLFTCCGASIYDH